MNGNEESARFEERGRSAQPYAPLPLSQARVDKPWSSKGWVWLIVALLGIAGIVTALWAIAGEIEGVGRAVQEQTGALREQSRALASVREEVGRLTASVDRLADTVAAVIGQWLKSI